MDGIELGKVRKGSGFQHKVTEVTPWYEKRAGVACKINSPNLSSIQIIRLVSAQCELADERLGVQELGEGSIALHARGENAEVKCATLEDPNW